MKYFIISALFFTLLSVLQFSTANQAERRTPAPVNHAVKSILKVLPKPKLPGKPSVKSITPRLVTATGKGGTMQCTKYSDADTQGAWCNYAYMCTGGCAGPFTIGQECYRLGDKTDFVGRPLIRGSSNPAVASVVCTVDYYDYAQNFIACNTKTESYACKSRAKSGTFATCHNCAPTHGIAMV